MGLARVMVLRRRGRYRDLILKPLKRIGVKIRPLKELDAKVRSIPAFKPGPIRTLYPIKSADAQRLLRAVGLQIRLERQAAKSEVVSGTAGAGFGTSESNREVESWPW